MSGNETEIKVAIASAAEFRRKLREIGFRILRRKILERNSILDTSPLSLRPNGCLLRVREAGSRTLITFKGKATVGKVKTREEIEFEANDASSVFQLFARMGFQNTFSYEKYRTEYSDGKQGGIVTLDETPIGTYAEIEGQESWIDETAARLGFHERDYITASYGSLYLTWCEQQRKTPGNMEFASTSK
jgi:adenylate cyclase class 2